MMTKTNELLEQWAVVSKEGFNVHHALRVGDEMAVRIQQLQGELNTQREIVQGLESDTQPPAQEPQRLLEDVTFVDHRHFGGSQTFSAGVRVSEVIDFAVRRFESLTKRIQALESAALLDKPPGEPASEPCMYCHGTGDVHDHTGEWRGECGFCSKPVDEREVLKNLDYLIHQLSFSRMGCPESVARVICEQARAALREGGE